MKSDRGLPASSEPAYNRLSGGSCIVIALTGELLIAAGIYILSMLVYDYLICVTANP